MGGGFHAPCCGVYVLPLLEEFRVSRVQGFGSWWFSV